MKAKVTWFAFVILHTKRIAGNDVVSGPITALAAASHRRKVKYLGGAHHVLADLMCSPPCGGRKEGPQGRKGSVTKHKEPFKCACDRQREGYLEVGTHPLQVLDLALDVHESLALVVELLQLLLLLTELLLVQLLPGVRNHHRSTRCYLQVHPHTTNRTPNHL